MATGDGDDSIALSPLSSDELFTEILAGEGNDVQTGGPGHESFTADLEATR